MMSTTPAQPSPDVTDPLAAALPGLGQVARVVARTRRGLLAAVLTTGLLLAVAVAVAWVVGSVVLDLAAPLPVAGRIAVLAGWCATIALAVAAFLLLPALRRPSIDVVALRIERALGGMHNRLLTVVDLARGGGTPTTGPLVADARGPGLVERLLAETAERMRGFRTRMVVPWGRLGRAVAWVAAGVGALALLHVTLGERLGITLDRLRQPTADIPPATWLTLAPPGDIDVLAREPFAIEARVARGTADAVDLVLVDAAGREARQPMSATAPGVFTARLEGLSAPVRYRLEGGGTWTRTHAITVVPRPEILAVERRIRLPDYMRLDAPLSIESEQRRIEAPVGSRVEWLVRTSGEAATGAIALAARANVAEVVERLDERVWFEDDLPRDAVAEVPWRWTTAQAAGGLRGFTFGSDHAPLAMRTRLEPLVLPKDALDRRDLSVMARLDPTTPPMWLMMALEHDKGRVELVWGDAAAAPPAEKARRVAVGPLPAPGDWARLHVPLEQVGELAGRSVTGVAFSIDGGRIHLDRPGWVERVEETVQRAVDTPAGSITLEPVVADPADGDVTVTASAADGAVAGTAAGGTPERRWSGAVPVERPLRAALEFASARGDANLPDPPTEIVPTADRPPALVVHGVPPTLSLARADDLPLTGTAFDDWGLDRIEIRVGPDPGSLGPGQPLAGLALADRPPDTQMTLPEIIRAEQLGLDAGTSVAWQLVVVDTKGQTAESAVFRVVVATPPEMELARSQTPSLAEARRAAEQLARDAERTADDLAARREAALAAVSQEARDAVAEVRRDDDRAAAPPEDRPQPDTPDPKRKDQRAADQEAPDQKAADAKPQDAKPADEKPREQTADRKAANARPQDAKADDAKPQPEKAESEKPQADTPQREKPQTEKQQTEKPSTEKPRRSAEEIAAAAEEAAREALAKLDEQDRARVAEAAAAVEQQRRAADDVAQKVQAAAAEARASRLVPAEQKNRLGELADEARALADALAPDPTLAEEAAMLDQIAAAAEPEEVAARARDLAEALADVERELDEAGAAMQIAGLAQDLERRADRLDALARAERAAPSPAAAEPAADRGPAANADQPPPAAPAPSQPAPQPPAQAQSPAQPQPSAAAPPESVAAAEPPRAAAPPREPAADAMPSDPPRSPGTAEARDQVRELRQILGEAAPDRDASTDEAAAAAEAAADRAARLAEQLAAGRPAPADGARPEAAPPGTPARPEGAGEPMADASPPALDDAQVRDALAMAQRARAIEAQAAREAARAAREQAQAARSQAEPGQPGEPGEPGQGNEPGAADQAAAPPQPGVPGTEPSDGGALLGAGRLESPLRGLDAEQRAAFEALPPRVRESLLEGMRQRGPEAYRATIDAYFRALGKELPR